jgi:hypothetical protein
MILFQPILLVTSGPAVQFVTANVSLSYLEGLADLSKPFHENLMIEQSQPLSLLDDGDVSEIILALSAIVDDYIALQPLFAIRKPLAPGQVRESLWWKLLVESIPYRDFSIDDDRRISLNRRGPKKRLNERRPKTYSPLVFH